MARSSSAPARGLDPSSSSGQPEPGPAHVSTLQVGSGIVPLIAGAAFPFLRASATLIDDRGFVAVVDCGDVRDRKRLEQSLARAGVAPARVELLILTHLHFDHCENADAFPRARVMLHWREVAVLERLLQAEGPELTAEINRSYEVVHPQYLRLLEARLTAHRDRYRALLADRGRLCLLEGDLRPSAAIAVRETPGHTPGHVSVLVHDSLWIAGDAVTSEQEWRQGEKALPQFCWKLADYHRSRAIIARTPGLVLPGHGDLFEAPAARAAASSESEA